VTETAVNEKLELAVIGGSGLYELSGMSDPREVSVDTPFGAPSDALLVGTIGGRNAVFLARHGRDHRLLPTEINHRANIFALKSLGVERVLSVSAVGSLRENIHPRDLVLVDQFIDRTHHRQSTFFGDGIVAHVGMADPVCESLRTSVLQAARATEANVHDGGTYVCMEGPAFSTRAESELYRSWGVQVIGMTNMQEAKLAREAELCYTTLALVTDYDCWHLEEADVSVEALLANLRANARTAAEVVRLAVASLPDRDACACSHALADALLTQPGKAPAATLERLAPIVGRYLDPAARGNS